MKYKLHVQQIARSFHDNSAFHAQISVMITFMVVSVAHFSTGHEQIQ